MKSRLAILFSGVADQEKKHLGKKASGIRDAWAIEWRIVRAVLGRLAFVPSPQPVFGPSPIGALVLGRLARGTGPESMVPTLPPFSCRGGRPSPVGKKGKLDCHFMGNSR